MGKINEYQRRQLASTAVGTAPPDKSGEIIGKSISQFGSGLVTQAQKMDEYDAIQANTAVMQFGLSFQNLATQIQTEMAANPDGYGERLLEGGTQLLESYAGSIADKGVREKFVTAGNTILRSGVAAAPVWAHAKKIDNVKIAMADAVKGAGIAVGQSSDIEELKHNLSVARELAHEQAAVTDADGKRIMAEFDADQYIKSVMPDELESYMTEHARNNPKQLMSDIEEGKFNDIDAYTSKMGAKYFNKAKRRLEEMDREAEQGQKETYNDVLLSLTTGGFSVAQVDALWANRHFDKANSLSTAQRRQILDAFIRRTQAKVKETAKDGVAKTYIKAINATFDNDIDRNIALNAIVEVWADGQMSDEEIQFLAQFGRNMNYARAAKEKNKIYKAGYAIKRWGSKVRGTFYSASEEAEDLSKLIGQVQHGVPAEIAAQKVMKERAAQKVIEDNPSLAGTEDPVEGAYGIEAERMLKEAGIEVNDKYLESVTKQMKAQDGS